MASNRVVYILIFLLFSPWQAYADSVAQQAKQALATGHIDKASDLLRQQVQSKPSDYQSWFLLGVAQARSQHYHQAIEAFRRVIELRNDLAEPHNNLAVIYNELGDTKAAVNELEQSLQKHPGYAVAEENIADLYIKLALQYYKKALEKKDDQALSDRYTRLLQVRDPHSKLPTKDIAKAQGFEKKALKKETAINTPQAIKPKALAVVKNISSEKDAVLAALEAWRTAWQRQDLKAYFSAYAHDYIPSKHASLAAWKAYKQRVITQKEYIKVTLSDIQPELSKNHHVAHIRFKQQFLSNSYNGSSVKVLKLEKQENVWKIIREVSISP